MRFFVKNRQIFEFHMDNVRSVRCSCCSFEMRSSSCSDCSLKMSCSVCSLFGLFAQNELFGMFRVQATHCTLCSLFELFRQNESRSMRSHSMRCSVCSLFGLFGGQRTPTVRCSVDSANAYYDIPFESILKV